MSVVGPPELPEAWKSLGLFAVRLFAVRFVAIFSAIRVGRELKRMFGVRNVARVRKMGHDPVKTGVLVPIVLGTN